MRRADSPMRSSSHRSPKLSSRASVGVWEGRGTSGVAPASRQPGPSKSWQPVSSCLNPFDASQPYIDLRETQDCDLRIVEKRRKSSRPSRVAGCHTHGRAPPTPGGVVRSLQSDCLRRPCMSALLSELRPGNPDDELVALVLLLRTELVPLERISTLVEESGSALSTLSEFSARSLFPPFNSEDIRLAIDTVSGWRAQKLDVRPVFTASYPTNLRGIFDKPALLFVQGDWNDDRDRNAIAIVGTRKPSPAGLRLADEVARKAVRAGLTVLSGMALGIDTAAHTAALEEGGQTAAVIGTGIDRLYPPENKTLRDRILASGGAILSQFFPDQPPAKWSFPMRNIVMSGLALATLVIEAGETSGAKKQARAALHHGRPVFLPKSLVDEHPWAQKMIDQGEYGVRAIEVSSIAEVIERLTAIPTIGHAIAV